MSTAAERQPRIEPTPNVNTRTEVKQGLFIAAFLCVVFALAGIKEGNNIGGLIAMGMGALSTVVGLELNPKS